MSAVVPVDKLAVAVFILHTCCYEIRQQKDGTFFFAERRTGSLNLQFFRHQIVFCCAIIFPPTFLSLLFTFHFNNV